MNLRQLNYFIAVAEELHFGKAAKRLFISQPALSFDIKKLEESLNVTLLNRDNKNITLTNAGRTLLNEARQLLQQAKLTEQLTKQAAHGYTNYFRIGFVNSMLYQGLNYARLKLQEKYPIQIILKEMNSGEQIKALQENQIDLGCVYSVHFPDNIQAECITKERFLCCLPKHHPLANSKSIDLQKLAKENFILFPRKVSPYYHDLIISLCVNAGFSPTILHEVHLWQTVIDMVSLNLGIALIPESICLQLQSALIQCIPLNNNSVLSERYIIYQKAEHNSVVDDFVKQIKAYHDPVV